ncbi:hypothetical protein PRZ48_000115 [Zasmidium cellare]|uniref:Uncharacterized protein n=1 Tax=Zasmidium cellare TaxID=395010 RepID=A0ABR0EZ91_ZASCE|nr:hypothetical protein PRZ48_000115 [Zasmidium cellare]
MTGGRTAGKMVMEFIRRQCHKGKQLLPHRASLARRRRSPRDQPPAGITSSAPDIVDNGPKPVISGALAAELSNVVLSVRKLELEDADTDAQISALDEEAFELHIAMMPLESQLGQARRASGPAAEIARLEAELAPMQEHFEQLKAEQQALHDEQADIHESQRRALLSLYATVEPMLVEHGLIQPLDEANGRNRRSEDKAQTPLAQPKAQNTVAIAPQGTPSSDDESATSLKPTSVQWQSSSIPTPTKAPVADSQKATKTDYLIAKAILHSAEDDFDFRSESFQQNRDEIEYQKVSRGKNISDESLLQLDMQELTETRRLATALAEAEANFTKAKEACLAANISIAASDLESGFLDDVDDGYRMSEENDIIASVNPAGVTRWMEQIPDGLEVDPDSDCQSDAQDAEIDWDARSVEIEDSASMVAEGASRRRIDKWREMCHGAEVVGLHAMGL